MGKRGENIRRRSDGRWEARVALKTPKGERTSYKYLYGRTYHETKARKQEFLLRLAADGTQARDVITTAPELDNASRQSDATPTVQRSENMPRQSDAAATASQPENVQPKISFAQVAGAWLDYKKPAVRASTYACYTVLVRNQILPELGTYNIEEIDGEILSDFFFSRLEHGQVKDGKPLSAKTVADLKGILRQIFTYAWECGMITKLPTFPQLSFRQPDIAVLTRQEQKLLEQTALKEDTPFTLGILISLYGGLRIGEVCALQWADFDFINGTVRVEKTVSRVTEVENGAAHGTRVAVGRPKTDCSIRTVPLPDSIMLYLQNHRRADSAYVLTGTEKLMEPRLCLARFKRFLKRAGLKERSWHCLRHTFATRCVESGVDVKSLSEMMGHSSVKITMQRYVHPSLDAKKEQVNKLPCFDESGQTSGQISGQSVVNSRAEMGEKSQFKGL